MERKGISARLYWANTNFNESNPYFCAAVITAMVFGNDKTALALLCLYIVFCRFVFILAYSIDFDVLRSVVRLVSRGKRVCFDMGYIGDIYIMCKLKLIVLLLLLLLLSTGICYQLFRDYDCFYVGACGGEHGSYTWSYIRSCRGASAQHGERTDGCLLGRALSGKRKRERELADHRQNVFGNSV